jgi:hypothetical protein
MKQARITSLYTLLTLAIPSGTKQFSGNDGLVAALFYD